jgi:hypothetical protein
MDLFSILVYAEILKFTTTDQPLPLLVQDFAEIISKNNSKSCLNQNP